MGQNKVAYRKSASWVLDQLHNNNMEFHGWGGGPTHYVVTPTRVEVELRLSWAVTIKLPQLQLQLPAELSLAIVATAQAQCIAHSLRSDELKEFAFNSACLNFVPLYFIPVAEYHPVL